MVCVPVTAIFNRNNLFVADMTSHRAYSVILPTA